jgi:hypothetical protein
LRATGSGQIFHSESLGRNIWDEQGGMGPGRVLLNTLSISYGRIHGQGLALSQVGMGSFIFATKFRKFPPLSYLLEAVIFPHIWAKASSFITPCSRAYICPRLNWARASPCSAASLDHFTAVFLFCGTPLHLLFITPRLCWALASAFFSNANKPF